MRPSLKNLVDRGTVLDEEIKSKTAELDEIKEQIKEMAAYRAGAVDGKIASAVLSLSAAPERVDTKAVKDHFGEDTLKALGFIKVGKPVLSIRFARKVTDVVTSLPEFITKKRNVSMKD